MYKEETALISTKRGSCLLWYAISRAFSLLDAVSVLFDDGGSVSIAAIAHLMGSLQAELSARDSPVMIHTLSPGMVLTGRHTSPSYSPLFVH